MAKKDINLGTQPTGVGGDTNRSANVKTNANFTELYKAMGAVIGTTNSGADGAVLPAALPVANGGTGAATAAAARTNLGVPSSSETMKWQGAIGSNADLNTYNTDSHIGFWRIDAQSSINTGVNFPPDTKSDQAWGLGVLEIFKAPYTVYQRYSTRDGCVYVRNATSATTFGNWVKIADKAGIGSVASENILPLAKGGTGATTAAEARTNLGLGTAATATVSQSKLDVANDRLLKVGDFGIGRNYQNIGSVNGVATGLPLSQLRGKGNAIFVGENSTKTLSDAGDYPDPTKPTFVSHFNIMGAVPETEHCVQLAYTNSGHAYIRAAPYQQDFSEWYQLRSTKNSKTDVNGILYDTLTERNLHNSTSAELPNLTVNSTGKITRSTQTLGTAATARLTESNTDSTVGRVLKVGDFGIGSIGISLSDPQSIDNIGNAFLSYNYNAAATTEADKIYNPAAGSAILGVKFHHSTPYAFHFGKRSTDDYPMFMSVKAGGRGGWRRFYTEVNTTVDSNGFLKAASPIVELYADRIELNDEAKQQDISFEKIGTGDYLIKGSSGLAQSGWYIEQPKDANGNVYHAVIHEQLENGDISIKTYEQKLDGVRIVADLEKPVDVVENRFISIRLQELPQPEMPIEEAPAEEQPAPVEPTIVDDEGNEAPSRLHELQDGVWIISEANAAILEHERLAAMKPLKRRQFRLTLAMNGHDLKEIEALIQGIEDPMQRTLVEIEWQDATDFERTNPTLLLMAGMMGLTTAQVDELWNFGLTL